ncbi:hypothetical protein H4219_003302 [Mycoemilia scoparia]|uniref:Methyltransferase type 11 domain-containing protein n=1 Tax=Mycoemilia scoparia TaxID=417184 RepID=A0A9W7ZZ48_9FUNG|nr:hypothetical protein H4219_003302 [Mycoemilia scoparia]
MSTYSKDHFDANNYEANRLTYLPEFVKELVEFHKKGQSTPQADSSGKIDVGVDVACGTGKFTTLMPPYFNQVIGTDLSQHMLDSAPKTADNIKYIACPAEALALEDNSADIVTVATGAHWFDPAKFLNEACRVLRPNGTLAIFGYIGTADFPKYPQLSPILREFAIESTGLGDYWDDGRDMLVEGYYDYMAILSGSCGEEKCCGSSEKQSDCWSDVERRVFPKSALDSENEKHGQSQPRVSQFELVNSKTVVADSQVVLEKKNMSWNGLRKFLSTWSALATYSKKNPNEPNMLDKYMKKMIDAAGATDLDEVLEIHWCEILILARCKKHQA